MVVRVQSGQRPTVMFGEGDQQQHVADGDQGIGKGGGTSTVVNRVRWKEDSGGGRRREVGHGGAGGIGGPRREVGSDAAGGALVVVGMDREEGKERRSWGWCGSLGKNST